MEIIVVGVISVLATLLGAWVGGRYSYKGAMDAVSKQIENQTNILRGEEVKKSQIASKIITKL